MDSKNKNILIGGLLAIVLVMAVGYAAFATQLNINGSAEITSSWDVHMTDTGKSVTPASTMGTSPSGNVTIEDGGLTANFTATLLSPGDSVTFTIPIENTGTLDATLKSITLASTSESAVVDNDGLTVTSADGNVKYTVTSPGTGVLAKNDGTANLVIKAEFVDKVGGQTNANAATLQMSATLTYEQANA